MVPLDADILLAFAKPMDDQTPVADNPPPAAPKASIGEYGASYSLTALRLYSWRRTHPKARWEDVTGTVFGTWTPDAGTRLQLLARSPFAFTRLTSRRWTDAFLATYPAWPCGSGRRPVRTCVDWPARGRNVLPALSTQPGATRLEHHVLNVVRDSAGAVRRLGGGESGRSRGPDALVRAARGRRPVVAAVDVPVAETVMLRAWSGGAGSAAPDSRG